MQIEAWPFRDTTPRNPAGWLIQAIENNYEPPEAFRQHQRRAGERRKLLSLGEAIERCSICDKNGYRRLEARKSSHAVMRQCTHDPSIEAKISPQAQNGIVEQSSAKDRPKEA